jgi:hypothetical protein
MCMENGDRVVLRRKPEIILLDQQGTQAALILAFNMHLQYFHMKQWHSLLGFTMRFHESKQFSEIN